MRPDVDEGLEPEIAILSLPGDRIAEAIAALPPGHAWAALLPGADASSAVAALGGADPATLALAAAMKATEAALGTHAILGALGLPFQVEPPLDLEAMARAMTVCGTQAARPPRPGGSEFEISLPGRRAAEGAALACLDYAAKTCLAGTSPDPLAALLTCPETDMRPLVRLADLDARFRFLEAMSEARAAKAAGRDGMERFRRSYFRRSAAAGLVVAVRRALAAPQWAEVGRDEDGWPVWWRAGVADEDEAEAALPPGLRTGLRAWPRPDSSQ